MLPIHTDSHIAALWMIGSLVGRNIRPDAAVCVEFHHSAVCNPVRTDAFAVGDVENALIIHFRFRGQEIGFWFATDWLPGRSCVIASEKMLRSRVGGCHENRFCSRATTAAMRLEHYETETSVGRSIAGQSTTGQRKTRRLLPVCAGIRAVHQAIVP